MEIRIDDEGNIKCQTTRKEAPYEVILSHLSQQLHLYNQMWAEEASFTAK
ncbi:hypothetical protein ACFLRF_01565 [Candidatus Altiarchaeota archaeon]